MKTYSYEQICVMAEDIGRQIALSGYSEIRNLLYTSDRLVIEMDTKKTHKKIDIELTSFRSDLNGFTYFGDEDNCIVIPEKDIFIIKIGRDGYLLSYKDRVKGKYYLHFDDFKMDIAMKSAFDKQIFGQKKMIMNMSELDLKIKFVTRLEHIQFDFPLEITQENYIQALLFVSTLPSFNFVLTMDCDSKISIETDPCRIQLDLDMVTIVGTITDKRIFDLVYTNNGFSITISKIIDSDNIIYECNIESRNQTAFIKKWIYKSDLKNCHIVQKLKFVKKLLILPC